MLKLIKNFQLIQKAVSATSKDNINITSSMINVTSVGADSIVIRI